MMKTVTNKIVELVGQNFEACESVSLRLDKFLNKTPGSQTERAGEIRSIVDLYNRRSSGFKKPSFRHPNAVELIATLQGNLIVNQSGGILENAGLCLDPIRNYPYVPGSAVKGVSSHAAYALWKDEGMTEEMALRIVKVFGFPCGHNEIDDCVRRFCPDIQDAVAGCVCFMPAVPWDNNVRLAEDICTSHHPEYYQKRKTVATDDEAPIPLVFPVVKSGAKFIFRLLPLRNCTAEALSDAQAWLVEAITVLGLGAKTAAGYGWFSFDEIDSANSLKEEKEREERQRIQAEKEAAQKAEAERKKKEEEERIAKKQALKAKLDEMTDEEKEDYLLSEMTDEQFRSEVVKFIQTKNPLTEERKKALVRALKDYRLALWNEIKNSKRQKNGPNWPQIVNDIRVFNKQQYGDRMP